MTGLLSLADVGLFYGDDDSIVDFGSARPFSQITLQGLGQPATLRPVGAEDVELVPISTGESITAQAWWGDRLLQADAIDGDKAFAVLILSASGTGVVLPARLRNPIHGGAEESSLVKDVISGRIMFSQRDALAVYLSEVHALTADRTVTTKGTVTYAVLTTAGTVGGTALATGIHLLGGQGGAVSGARGWLVSGAVAAVG